MYSSKAHSGVLQATPQKHRQAVIKRQRLQPFSLHLGPASLYIISVFLIGLMAVLYLSQMSQAVAANQNLQDIRSEQADLSRQDQDLVATIANEQSPGYIAKQATLQGLVPADPSKVWVVAVHNLQPITKQNNGLLP
jgi:cell division protein FtsL